MDKGQSCQLPHDFININNLAENWDVQNTLVCCRPCHVEWTYGKYTSLMQRKWNKALALLSTYCELWKLRTGFTNLGCSIDNSFSSIIQN